MGGRGRLRRPKAEELDLACLMALGLAASLGAKRRALAVRCLRSKDLARSLTLESEATHMHLSPSPWSNDRIDQLKRCFDAGLTCSQIAREIGVTRNAVIGKMNRMGLSRPRDVVDRQLEQRRDAKLARPIPRLPRPKRPRLNVLAQREILREAFPEPKPATEDIP